MSFKSAVLWLGMMPVGWVVGKVPLGFSYWVAGLVSWSAYFMAVKRRRILKEEVRLLFGDRFSDIKIKKIIRRTFAVYLKRQVENVAFDRITENRLRRMVTVEGWENLQRAEKKKRGVILLLSHFGSFLLPLPFLAYKGYCVHQVAGKPLISRHDVMGKKIFEARKRQTDKMPLSFLLTNKYLGPVVRALRKGDVVVIAFDGRSATEMLPMSLLNRMAQFSPGPFKLAKRTGAVILPTFVVRGDNNKHRIIFESPMDLKEGKDGDDGIMLNMTKFLEIFQRYLLKYPCHFAMTLFSLREEAKQGFNPPLFLD